MTKRRDVSPDDAHAAAGRPRRVALADAIERLHAASDLRPDARAQLADWLAAHAPFADADDLHRQLAAARLRGVKREQGRAIVDALIGRLGRRAFLGAALGAVGGAAIAAGLHDGEPAPASDAIQPWGSADVRAVIAAMQTQQATAGETLRAVVGNAAPADASASLWDRTCHALDMSNWLEAAELFAATPAAERAAAVAQPGPARLMARALDELHQAWNQVLAVRKQWSEDYFVAYALGRLPALSPGAADQPPLAGDDAATRRALAVLMQLAPLCHALDVTNQRFQAPGRTADGAAIRFTQGHNFSFAHFTADWVDGDAFQPDRRRVLVNWDAHADLSPPLENPRTDVPFSLEQLQASASHGERVVAASSMSIAGWILPLVYQQHLGSATAETPAEILWIVPREALATSHDCMEPFGSYRATVGAWRLPASREAMAAANALPLGPWNVPGSVELRSHSEQATLRSIRSADLLADPRTYVVHIVEPEDAATIAKIVGDAELALSVDVDFAGTREPSTLPRRGFLPHYPLTATPAERERHRQLIALLGNFYDKYRGQIRSVSLANSPTFTVEEGERMPAARMLEIFTRENLAEQPGWVRREIDRAPAPEADAADARDVGSRWALLGGGTAGIVAAAGLLISDLRRRGQLHDLLFRE